MVVCRASTKWTDQMEFRLLGSPGAIAIEPERELSKLTQALVGQAEALGPEASGRPTSAAPAGTEQAALEGQKSAQDVRRTVTILFNDIVDSSRLSLALDPEALQNLLVRYFGEM